MTTKEMYYGKENRERKEGHEKVKKKQDDKRR
jgi:hypothetical protein